jgi:hypothetical protein
LSICSRHIKIQKHIKNKVLTGVELILLRGEFAVAVQRFKTIRPRFNGVGQPDSSEPLAAGDAIGVTRSGNCPPPDWVNQKLQLRLTQSYPAFEGLRSPVSAFSAALLISEA